MKGATLRFDGVAVRVGDRTILEGIDFVVPPGEVVGLVVTERDEPQAVYGSTLHRDAFPARYKKFVEEEIGGDRIKLCQLLSQMCSLDSYGKVLFPMDIGMRIRLPTLEVFCQEQGHSHWVQPQDIVPHLPSGSDGIVYYCH